MRKIFLPIIVALLLVSCKGKDEKTGPASPVSENKISGGNEILNLDESTLKDEASFLKAWEDFTAASAADEKKRNEDKSYQGYYLEYLKKYTSLLKATTAFSKTITPASAAVAFGEKVNAIQNKMHTK